MKKTACLLFILLLAAGLSFGQRMSNPMIIAKTTNGVRWSQMAFGPDGVAHFIWEEFLPVLGHGIFYASYDGQTASTPLSLATTPTSHESRPNIAVGPQGKIVAVWGQEDSVYMRVFDPAQKKWLPEEAVKIDAGRDEPCAAVDAQGNIFIWWYTDGAGIVYSRAKINGQWEETRRLSPGTLCKQGGIGVGSDGWVWAVWREKQGNGEYKLYYSKRTKDTAWTTGKVVNNAGGSSSHPGLTVGPDKIAYAVHGDIDEETGHNQEMWVIKIDEKTNPREMAIPLYLAHYPRIAIDNNGVKHVVSAIGGGDGGDGVQYTNNAGGTYKERQLFGGVWPKVPGISHNGFGNVAICWSSMDQNGYTHILMSSLQPITRISLNPPIDLSASMSFDPNDPTKFTYSFNWKANNRNADSYLQGYRIYREDEDGTGALVTVAKTATSASLTLTEFDEDARFGVATVGLSGGVSDIAWFDIAYPEIYAPVSLVASIKLSKLMTVPEITADLSWAANPQNTASYVKEYRIYKKESGGNFVLIATIPKTSTSTSITISSLQKKIQLGITTASVLNKESTIALF